MDSLELAAAPRLRPDIIYSDQIGRDGIPDLGDPAYAWHLLAEGDSWFSIGAIPSSNLLYDMRFRRWTQILNLAAPGDTLKRMGSPDSNRDLKKWLGDARFTTKFSGLLLSGGGNDLFDAARSLVSREPLKGGDPTFPGSYVHREVLEELIRSIQTSLREIVSLRDGNGSKSANAPAFVHTYDYATPRKSPSRFLKGPPVGGPWLYPVLHPTGLDIVLQQGIADLLVDRLAEGLLALDSERGSNLKLENFHVVDTRDTLVRANPTEFGSSNDWENEIHPTHDGYRKIAARIASQVNRRLPDPIVG